MKIATVTLGWRKSVSADVQKVKLTVTNGGVITQTELPAETEQFSIQVKASTAFSFSLVAIDGDGEESTTVSYSQTLGDLIKPEPPTDLFHRVESVDDVSDRPPL